MSVKRPGRAAVQDLPDAIDGLDDIVDALVHALCRMSGLVDAHCVRAARLEGVAELIRHVTEKNDRLNKHSRFPP